MRKYLLALAGIGLFGAVCMLGVYFATEPGPGRPTPAAPPPLAEAPPPAPPPAPAPAPAPAVAPGALPRLQEPGPLPVYAPKPPPPPAGTWEAVAPVARPASLGPVGAAIGRGLIELQPRVATCFEAAGGSRSQADVTTVAEVPTDDHGVTVLMLQIETQSGKARIVDAPVETYGGASEAVVACAQRMLRGQVLPAPGAKPGTRHRILFTLTP